MATFATDSTTFAGWSFNDLVVKYPTSVKEGEGVGAFVATQTGNRDSGSSFCANLDIWDRIDDKWDRQGSQQSTYYNGGKFVLDVHDDPTDKRYVDSNGYAEYEFYFYKGDNTGLRMSFRCKVLPANTAPTIRPTSVFRL